LEGLKMAFSTKFIIGFICGVCAGISLTVIFGILLLLVIVKTMSKKEGQEGEE